MASHRPLQTPRLTILPADIARLEAMVSSAEAFSLVTGCRVAKDFCPFDGVLVNSLTTMRRASDQERPWWTPRFIVLSEVPEVIGLTGFKGPPQGGSVEIGYSIAPAHQNQGFATEAICALASHAARLEGVRMLCAHTLPQVSSSTRVLEKSGFRKVAQVTDPEDGPVWRWERLGNI